MESFNSTRWIQDKIHFENKILELGGEIIVKESNGNEAVQFQQVQELINEGIDVLVIVPSNVNTAATIVREAHKKNIKVIAYDRLIKNAELDYFVGFDAHQIGIIQAKYAINISPKGNYVLIEGDMGDYNAKLIEKGHMQELQSKIESGNIKILYKIFIEEWSPEVAAYEYERVYDLSNENIDAVLSANDGMASGIINLIEKKQINKPIITGLDAELEACRRIVRGQQSMTVYTPIKNLAISAAELAMKIANKAEIDYQFEYRNNNRINVPSLILKPIAVDKSNIESTIIKDGVYTKEEIFGN